MFSYESYTAWSTAEDGGNKFNKFVSLDPELTSSGSGGSSTSDELSGQTTSHSTPSWGSPSKFPASSGPKNILNPETAAWTGRRMLEAAPAWNGGGQWPSGEEERPAWEGEGLPDWESAPAAWDHDSAQKLAEQLLVVQDNDRAEKLAEQLLMVRDNFSLMDVKDEVNESQYGRHGNDCSNPRFKTEFCRNFREKGVCLYGDLCQFAHGRTELRQDVVRHNKYKTKLCQKFWIHGYCAYGPRCNFIHQEKEGTEEEQKPPVCGFKPFHVNGFRKNSESSVDSGIEAGFTHPPPKLDNMAFPPPSVQSREQVSLVGLKSRGFQEYNLNLPSEINRNLNLAHNYGISQFKDQKKLGSLVPNAVEHKLGGSLVPHPEHNPIPANTSLTGLQDFKLESGDLWRKYF